MRVIERRPPKAAPPDKALHAGLLWLQAPEEIVEALLSGALGGAAVARPAPDLVAFSKRDQAKVVQRLQKLGHPPEIVAGEIPAAEAGARRGRVV